jgi:triphosphoribosyl-dephospho-CoA synthase
VYTEKIDFASLAVKALYRELCVYPKPGCVSFEDNGSHRDMDSATFVKSMDSLYSYFTEIAVAGSYNAPFADLKKLGLEAEKTMLQTTKGVNTHKGAIFILGILTAAAANAMQHDLQIMDIPHVIQKHWGQDLKKHVVAKNTHGAIIRAKYAVKSVVEEASEGFPIIFNYGLPIYQSVEDEDKKSLQTFFAYLAEIDDTNLLHRGGKEGLDSAKAAARSFLKAGGVYTCGYFKTAKNIHRDFIRKNLSPGGSADLLSATIFIDNLLGTSWF